MVQKWSIGWTWPSTAEGITPEFGQNQTKSQRRSWTLAGINYCYQMSQYIILTVSEKGERCLLASHFHATRRFLDQQTGIYAPESQSNIS
jgi:hypothetical protein